MRRRMMIAAVGAVLVVAGFASAQDVSISFRGFTEPGPKPTLSNVEIEVNGVTLRADRAVPGATPNEFTLEGNVRVTFPSGVTRFTVRRAF